MTQDSPATSRTAARLLLAEDDTLMRMALVKGLVGAGHEVVDVATGDDAIDAAHATEFDLAIFDMHLPGISGLEAAQTVRRETGLPFIVLSVHGDDATVGRALEAGALGYLVKPLDVAQILPGVEAALRRARDIARLESSETALRHALSQTRDISVAIGLVMARRNLARDAAFELLRTAARSARLKLTQVAAEIIDGKRRL